MSRGLELLRERTRRVPSLLRDAAALPEPELGVDPERIRRWLVTGIGSAAGNARFLASVLSDELGLPARFVPTAALARADAGAGRDALVVFSQGLSPNACHALAGPERFARAILVTAVDPRTASPERAARLARAVSAGVRVVPMPAALGEEAGLLVRVAGPLVGYALALSIARTLAAELGAPAQALAFPTERVCARLAQTPQAAAEAFPIDTPLPFRTHTQSPDPPLVLLASGGYGERAQNLRIKALEGMLLPCPPLWDLLDFSHGPFQQLHDGPATLVALTRADAPDESDLLERLGSMLPARHDLRRMRAELPGPLAILDHEAQWNALLLRQLEETGRDPADWPGRDRDAPLYELGAEPAPPAARARAPAPVHAAVAARLETLTWPELEAALAAGRTAAVLPLGSTEQHGPHLPFATDSWVADALAARFCARVPEALRLPVVTLGCASEHLAFPGTLSLEPSTLEAVLRDLLASLRRHGFERAFVFSAHGGNAGLLRDALPRLRDAAGPLRVTAFTDHGSVAAACEAAARAFGVAPEAAGHHAGELETSLVAALRAGAVRETRLEPGWVEPCAEPQSLFYPDLRANAPNGVVGDPRGADPARAEAYLAAWVDRLVETWLAEKNRHQTNGTVSP